MKKLVSRLLSALALVFLVGAPFVSVKNASGQAPPPGVTPVTTTSEAFYTFDGLDVSGASEHPDHADVALFAASTPTPIAADAVFIAVVRGPLVQGENVTPMAGLLVGRADGEYLLTVRNVDLAGNNSVWGDPVRVLIDTTPPSPPSGIGCRSVTPR